MELSDSHLVVDRRPKTGANSSRVRDHNERSVLSLLREQGPSAASAIAKALNLSTQTASVIVRELRDQGLVHMLEPVKGKVGKPQTPIALAADGAYSYGLRIGRRTCDLVLIDLLGGITDRKITQYPYPNPAKVEDFANGAICELSLKIPEDRRPRIVGIGIAAPFQLWQWLDGLGAPKAEADKWRDYCIGERFFGLTGLPTSVANDVNLACMGELMLGNGSHFRDFVYFYVGYFVGGAIVMDGKVVHGARGNAGALGSIPVAAQDEKAGQLIDVASIFSLERELTAKLGGQVNLRAGDRYWFLESGLLNNWIEDAASATAEAAVAAAAVLDISDIVVDGVFPPAVRKEFVTRLKSAAECVDQRGIYPVNFHEGRLGPDAGQLGAAYQPIISQLLVEGSQLM